jgi:hypothetical protein
MPALKFNKAEGIIPEFLKEIRFSCFLPKGLVLHGE